MNKYAKIDKRADTEHTGNERGGIERHGDCENTKCKPEHSELLEEETHGKRGRPEETTMRTKENGSLSWSMSALWNAGLASVPQRPLEKRNHLWASELYGAPIDIWLKMHAIPYTNKPNERSLMKFEAAHLVEWIISMILKRAGVLRGEEERVEYQKDGLLKVTGRMDKLAGGKPQYDTAIEELKQLELPDGFILGTKRVIEGLNERYKNGLGEKPIEIKSVSSFAMDSMERNKKPIKRHRVQLYHYLMAKQYKVGLLVYICRDDSRMIDFNIFRDSYVKNEYFERIKLLTENAKRKTAPDIEQLLVWDDDFHKFSKNFNVEYSNYLTKLYGYETPRDYSDEWGKKAMSWNRILKRVKEGSKITEKNAQVITEIEKAGYNIQELAETLVAEETA